MIVAGIDPSLTNTGIAILDNGAPHRLHSIGFNRQGESYDHRSRRIVAECRAVTHWVDDTVNTTGIDYPELIMMEGPAYAYARPSTHDNAGLWWGLFSAFRQHSRIVVIPPSQLKLWAVNNGTADKKVVTAEVRTWWPDVRIANHDIADACALGTIGSSWAGDPVPFELKGRHRTILETVAWPVIA